MNAIIFKLLSSLFKSVDKEIAFLDCDQPLPGIFIAKNKYLSGVDCVMVRQCDWKIIPKTMKECKDSKKVCISGYRPKSEATDKYIAILIQKAILDGYNNITVVSSDFDYIDIFKMAILANNLQNKNFKFRLLMPYTHTNSTYEKVQETKVNIEIVKMN